jgi:fructosamine-3-kinase
LAVRLPTGLQASLADQLGVALKETRYCAGGDINHAAQLVTADGVYFVKWNEQSPPGMFTAEAQGLLLLREADSLPVPGVIAVCEAAEHTPAYLVLEWLEPGGSTPETARQLGEGLAALHRHVAPQHGLDHANFIGSLPQSNHPQDSWADFYAEQRLRPQMELARRQGRLPAHRERLLHKLIERLPDFLPAENPPASLLHGDLWAGNVMTLTGGRPAIVDPAVYYGHREVELAFTELFGGFNHEFYAAYNAVYPLDKDYPTRRALYQLYPLMVHLNLFGGGYGARVDEIASRYGG